MISALFYWLLGKVKNLKSSFDSHKADPSAHHTRYTDTESVEAVENADPLELNNALSINGGYLPDTSYKLSCNGFFFNQSEESLPELIISKFGSINEGDVIGGLHFAHQPTLESTPTSLIKMEGLAYDNGTTGHLLISAKEESSWEELFELIPNGSGGYVDIKGGKLKDMLDYDDAVLSGTPRIVEIDIDGTPYYFKVYPTKT